MIVIPEVRKQRRVLATPVGDVPALICTPAGRADRPAVLFYHGLRASKEVHRKEGQSLAEAGFAAVLIEFLTRALRP